MLLCIYQKDWYNPIMNMEMPPMGENNQEKIEKGKVLEMLRTNGLDHIETKELVMEWTEQKEAEVEKENTSRATIVFNIERSDLYIAMGDKEGATECLEDALAQADQENEKELQDQIIEKLKSLK
jgi:FimV-like protein